MAENKAFGPARCKRLAYASLRLAAARLLTVAKRNGGSLTVSQLQQVLVSFRNDPEDFRQLCDTSFRSCWDAALTLARRQDLFGRLVVRQFSHLFPDPDEPGAAGEGVLSRSILPSFLSSLQVICGAGFVARARERCADILKKIQGNSSPDIDWEEFYRHPEAVRVLHMTLVLIARHFQRKYVPKRDTFIEMMTYRPSEAGFDKRGGMEAEPEPEVHFDRDMFGRLMLELFACVRIENLGAGGDAALAESVSEQGVAAIREFILDVKKDAGLYFAYVEPRRD